MISIIGVEAFQHLLTRHKSWKAKEEEELVPFHDLSASPQVQRIREEELEKEESKKELRGKVRQDLTAADTFSCSSKK